MHQFYFNECLPLTPVYISDFASLLSNTIKEFDYLTKKNISVDTGIILEKEAGETLVCGCNLKESIKEIKDKDIKTLAFAYFTKYPIQSHLKSDEMDETLLEEDFRCEGFDAVNLAIANHYNCFLFSVAAHDCVKKNALNIKGNTKQFDIDNLFGEVPNTGYIESRIAKINADSLGLFEQLKVELNSPIYTSAFEKAFLSESDEVQKAIIDLFKKAKERSLTTPFLPDGLIIKDVTSSSYTGTAKVYELRLFKPKALRVYFYEQGDKVYLSNIGYKNAGESCQSKDIRKALNNINTLIKTR